MEKDPNVFVMGIGVDDHKAVFGTTRGLVEKFGRERVFDTPISEAAMAGIAIGAAINGMRPVHVHMRADFLYLTLDQLFNMAAKWRSMFGGKMSVPLVVRAVIGRSWGQGAQHSQSPQSFFMNVPGFKVVMPTTPADAQGLTLAALADSNPVLILEHRLLYDIVGDVPDPPRATALGKTAVRRTGRESRILPDSYMVVESLKAAEFLATQGIDVEIVDPVSSRRSTANHSRFDRENGAPAGRRHGLGFLRGERGDRGAGGGALSRGLKAPVRRLGMAPVACPVSKPLEKLYYPDARTIAAEVFAMMGRRLGDEPVPALSTAFKGPF